MFNRHKISLSRYYRHFLMVTLNFCTYPKVERGQLIDYRRSSDHPLSTHLNPKSSTSPQFLSLTLLVIFYQA